MTSSHTSSTLKSILRKSTKSSDTASAIDEDAPPSTKEAPNRLRRRVTWDPAKKSDSFRNLCKLVKSHTVDRPRPSRLVRNKAMHESQVSQKLAQSQEIFDL